MNILLSYCFSIRKWSNGLLTLVGITDIKPQAIKAVAAYGGKPVNRFRLSISIIEYYLSGERVDANGAKVLVCCGLKCLVGVGSEQLHTHPPSKLSTRTLTAYLGWCSKKWGLIL